MGYNLKQHRLNELFLFGLNGKEKYGAKKK
jgi:hypothetical protein